MTPKRSALSLKIENGAFFMDRSHSVLKYHPVALILSYLWVLKNDENLMKFLLTLSLGIFSVSWLYAQHPSGELIFPLQEKHVHASSIVELPGGDLLVCWFEGSGERTANDVVIKGARLKKGQKSWSESFLMADTPGQPDCNPVMFLNRENKLFLIWIVVRANRWENSLLKVKTSTHYGGDGAPSWDWQDVLLLKPGDEFAVRVKDQFEKYGRQDLAWAEYALPYEELLIKAAQDPKKRETGWMTRTHPLITDDGTIMLPLYSDGFNFGLVAISADGGKTWKNSLPIIGRGVNQPGLIMKEDGTMMAYMRDDGDEPARILVSRSEDGGHSWTYAEKSNLPNPGASIEVLKLKSGNWLLVYNDTDDGRYSLAVALSDDEGQTWRWKKKLEYREGVGFSYPSVIQAQDGTIHVTYSYHLSDHEKSIKHVSFAEEWIKTNKK